MCETSTGAWEGLVRGLRTVLIAGTREASRKRRLQHAETGRRIGGEEFPSCTRQWQKQRRIRKANGDSRCVVVVITFLSR